LDTANPELASLRFQVEMARQEVEKQRAGHHPTLDLVAARQYGANESNVSINSKYNTDYVGIQMTIPIFSGGGVSAAVRQAEANLDKARFQLEASRKRLGVETQKYFQGVLQGIEKIKAFEASLHAAEQSLVSNRKGFQAGTRTVLDILNAAQRLADAKRALSEARYVFLLDRLRLAAMVGQLDEDIVARINTVLAHERSDASP
jgi:outer membrane protein TolC